MYHQLGADRPFSSSFLADAPPPGAPSATAFAAANTGSGGAAAPLLHDVRRHAAKVKSQVSSLIAQVMDDDAGERPRGRSAGGYTPVPNGNGFSSPAAADAAQLHGQHRAYNGVGYANQPPGPGHAAQASSTSYSTVGPRQTSPFARTTPSAATSPQQAGYPAGPGYPWGQDSRRDSSGSGSGGFFYPTPDSGVSRQEVFRMIANRFIFSRFYKVFYVSMTLLALVTIIMSFSEACPSTAFLVLECVVNLSLIAEVGVRFLATRKQFFKSVANIFDVILLGMCFVLLGMLFYDSRTCVAGVGDHGVERSEALADSILLMVRNLLQFSRIASMLRKNQNQLTHNVGTVDFTSLEGGTQSTLLFEADELPPLPASMGRR